MDRIAQKIADWLGSTIVIVLFGLWLMGHNVVAKDYVTFISDMAIWIGLLILRAEKVQSDRMERDVKRDLKKSDDILSKLPEPRQTRGVHSGEYAK